MGAKKTLKTIIVGVLRTTDRSLSPEHMGSLFFLKNDGVMGLNVVCKICIQRLKLFTQQVNSIKLNTGLI